MLAVLPALLARLNGITYLVRGNNDAGATGEAAGWAGMQDYAELTVNDSLPVLRHYPFRR